MQRLHVRWWHASTEALTRTLRAAGAPAQALGEIAGVVQACMICRDWKTPGPKNITTFRLVLEFNEEVQFDLLFYHSLLEPTRGLIGIAHLIDVCVRFSLAAVSSKEEAALTATIGRIWISIFGPMTTLTLDEESGMRGQCAMDWASANGVHLRFKAPRQKAWIVERHNEVIRRSLHKTESQLVKEALNVPFEQALATVIFMKNALTVINSSTPYQAVFGRQPALLPPMEGGHLGQVRSDARVDTNSRHDARVREIAAVNIIEATARARLDRADKTNTRAAVERFEYKPDDNVDIWFEPSNKDQPGWRGPAAVLSVNAREGNITVRIQGRTLTRQIAEIREHIPYLVYSATILPDQ